MRIECLLELATDVPHANNLAFLYTDTTVSGTLQTERERKKETEKKYYI